MPINLIPSQLRLFNNPSLSLTRLTSMKFTHSFQSSRATPVFSRVFPFKLKYSGLRGGVPVLKNGPQQLGFRKFSTTQPFRPRSGSSSSSEFSRGKERGGEIRASKSLVEDEAELSDWISDLKTDSFRGRATSDEEGEDLNKRRSSVRSRGTDSVPALKRRREGDSNQFGDRRSSGRGDSFDSSPRSSRGGAFNSNSRRRVESGSEGSDGEMYPRRNNDRGGSRGGSSSFGTRRGGSARGGLSSSFGMNRGGRDSSFGNRRDSEDSDDGLYSGRSNRGGSRGGSSSFESRRGGSSSFESRRGGSSRGGRDSSFGNRRDSEDSDDGLYSGRSNRGGSRGGSSSFESRRGGSSSFESRRGGRDSSFGNRRDSEGNDDGLYSGRSNRGGSRGGSSSFEMRRGGSSRGGRDSNFGNRRDSDNNDGELFSRKSNDGGSRGGSSSFATRRGGSSRGGRDSNFGSRPDQGTMGSAKRAPMISEDEDDVSDDDDDDEVKTLNNFKDLLGEDDSEDEVEVEVEVEDEDEEDDDDEDIVIKKNPSSLFIEEKEVTGKVSPRKSPGQDDSYLSESRFDQCSVSPLSLKGVKDAGYEKMTMVQEATLPVILKGKDVLAKAKTGTGKTVAFLLPSIEVVVKSDPVGRDQKRPPIFVLVICPTRELASQAAAEANKLLKYHPSIGVQVVIGGTRLALEQKRMQANPCQILVATPGRLKDHIENTAGFATRMMGVKVLVLDEADHLLDMGFRKDIEKIISAVPKQRQTLLFSATVPDEVRQICHIALKRDHEFINAVQEGSEETHAQVRQMHLVAPLDKHFSLLYALLKEHISDDVDYKVLVFCTTAMVTRLVASLLGELNLNVREIHSRKPQSYRTRVSDEFRKSKGLILVTSDVSARGVDYPDVTLVIQVGLPSDREQYIHRLGRTGRKGKEGQGILLLAPWEEYFLAAIKDLPITKAPVPSVDPDTRKKVERGLSQTEMKNKEAAYQSWLGYYNSVKNVGKDKHRLVELANDFSRSMGLDTPPAIPKVILGKMGLKNIPGLRIK